MDLGFSSAFCREVAVAKGSSVRGAVRSLFYRWTKVYFLYQFLLLLICSIILFILVAGLGYEANTPILFLVILSLILRLSANLLKQGLIGTQNHLLMNLSLFLGNLIRYVLPVILLSGFTSAEFLSALIVFWFLSVSFEVALQSFFFLRASPKDETLRHPVFTFHYKEVLHHKNFMFFSALSTFIWLFSSYLDRFAVDAFYSPQILATYTLVSTLCLSVFMLSTSVVTVAIPKFVEIWERGEVSRLKSEAAIYHTLTIGLIFPVWIFLVCLPEEFFFLWTGNVHALEFVQRIFPVLVSLNVVMALGSVVYAIHFATGSLLLHIRGSFVSTLVHFLLFFALIKPHGIEMAILGCLIFRTLWLFVWSHFSLNSKVKGVGFSLNVRTFLACCALIILYALDIDKGSMSDSVTRMETFIKLLAPGAAFCVFGLLFIFLERVLSNRKFGFAWLK